MIIIPLRYWLLCQLLDWMTSALMFLIQTSTIKPNTHSLISIKTWAMIHRFDCCVFIVNGSVCLTISTKPLKVGGAGRASEGGQSLCGLWPRRMIINGVSFWSSSLVGEFEPMWIGGFNLGFSCHAPALTERCETYDLSLTSFNWFGLNLWQVHWNNQIEGPSWIYQSSWSTQ